MVRRLTAPQKYKSLGYLMDYIADVGGTLNNIGEKNRGRIVTQICTYDSVAGYYSSYIPKNCICLISTDKDGYEAMKKGAILLITKKEIRDLPCYVCDNPVAVFAKLCRYYRDLQKDVSIVAVSGSIGKSTVKNMIGEVLKHKFNTCYAEVNYNTRMAVGFAVQHIPNKAEKMVQEIHEGNPDETRYISAMLHPDVFVITPIDKSHFLRFGSQEKIIEEICSISEYMTDNGYVVVNSDEFNRYDLLNDKKVVTVSSVDDKADFLLKNVVSTEEGLRFSVLITQSKKEYTIEFDHIYAHHNATNALYAFAVGVTEGVRPEDVVAALSNYRTKGLRQNVIHTDDGITIYADCYNAVGRSMKAAIEACDSIPVKGKRLAVLGNIEEAGEESLEMHKDIIACINDSKFDCLYVIGDKMKEAVLSVSTRTSITVSIFDSLETLAAAIKKMITKGDLVLFKASHSVNLEKCIKMNWPEVYKNIVSNNADTYVMDMLKY